MREKKKRTNKKTLTATPYARTSGGGRGKRGGARHHIQMLPGEWHHETQTQTKTKWKWKTKTKTKTKKFLLALNVTSRAFIRWRPLHGHTEVHDICREIYRCMASRLNIPVFIQESTATAAVLEPARTPLRILYDNTRREPIGSTKRCHHNKPRAF